MITPSTPTNEPERLAALRSYEVLDTPPEQSFDDLTKLAAYICGTPSASITLVDQARQWFKARVGVAHEETARDIAFCAHGILQADLLIVPDATKDARFTDNPLVNGPDGIRFYVGAPLATAEGYNLGMLCVTDHQPRILTAAQQDALRLLASQVVAQLDLRKRTRQLQAEITERKRVVDEWDKFFTTSLDLLCVCSGDGSFLRVNPTFEKVLGWKPEELLPTPFIELVHPEDRSAVLEQVGQILAGSSVVEFEVRCRAKNGSYRWISWMSTAADQAGLFIPCGRDVTERKKAEETLRLSEERFRRAFDNAPIGMALVNPDGRWLKVNHALRDMLGYGEEELLATDFQHLTHPDDLTKDLDMVGHVLKGTIPSYQMEKRYFHKTGRLVFVLLSVSLVRDAGGVPLYFVSQIENISERKEVEEALRVSEERFRLVVDGVKDYALLMLDPGGFVVSWSAGAQDMKGYRAEEIIGQHFSRFYLPEAVAHGHPQEELAVASSEGRYEENGWRVRKDGTRFMANVVLTAIRDQNGKLRGFAKITRDITESERREADREKIIAELQEVLTQVKTLSGLIPICGWCKSVRSDSGYWQTVEQYVRTNTSASFSHGICPTCSVKFKDEISRSNGVPPEKAPAR